MSRIAPRVQSPVPATWADIAYQAAAPVVFAGVHVGARVLGAPADDLRQRTGHLPGATAPLLWFHGASAGEVAGAAHLVQVLRRAGYRFNVGYTTTNAAGIAMARSVATAQDVVSMAPWDAPHWVARALDRWQPRGVFLVETELWPRLVLDAHRRCIPVFSVSARIYPRDALRYRLVRPLIMPMLRRLAFIATQNEAERGRFVRLGADAARCVVVGDIKHAAPPPDPRAGAHVRALLGLRAHERVVVCGSVHGDEVAPVMAALVANAASNARFIVAPRHADAVNTIVAAGRDAGWRTCLRSDAAHAGDWRLLVVDTHGELPLLYHVATVAVVGGGFTPHGGHNLWEPVRAGAAVLFGTQTEHAADDAARLRARVPEACVADTHALAERLGAWLHDDILRARVRSEQHAVLPDGAGIAKGYVAVLSPWLREMGLESV